MNLENFTESMVLKLFSLINLLMNFQIFSPFKLIKIFSSNLFYQFNPSLAKNFIVYLKNFGL